MTATLPVILGHRSEDLRKEIKDKRDTRVKPEYDKEGEIP